MAVNPVGMVAKGVVTQGAKLVKAIKTPDVVLDVEHLVGAKYSDVIKSLGAEGFFERVYGPTRVIELPSGNKLIKLTQERFRGKKPVNPIHEIAIKFNKDGDCLQLTDINGTWCGPRNVSIVRTPKGKEALRPYMASEPKTYQSVSESLNFRYVDSSDIPLPYGTEKTVQKPAFGSPSTVSKSYRI